MPLEIKPRSGKSSLVNLEDLNQKVKVNPTSRTRKLSEKLGPSKDTACRPLHKLQKTHKNSREVPHKLTSEQANHRVELCKIVLKNPQDLCITNA